MFKKDEVNNAIVTKLMNVRKHPNADRLQLATVLSTTVVVGLEAQNDDVVIYFDSNLALSPDYLKKNNLYSNSELNEDTTKKGYFGKNGRVKAQTFRGEISNGYVASIDSVAKVADISPDLLTLGIEFQDVNNVNICQKYVPKTRCSNSSNKTKKNKKKNRKRHVKCDTFVPHWDTKHFARELNNIPEGMIYIEEKIHGTSARSGNLLVTRNLKWYERFLKKIFKLDINDKYWYPVNGSRRVVLTFDKDTIQNEYQHSTNYRDIIFNKLKPNLNKGEQVYYEIAGYNESGGFIQKDFPYGCKQGEHIAILYRVTQNTEDGKVIDMNREYVYNRADELGLTRPILFEKFYYDGKDVEKLSVKVQSYTDGKSMLDNTIREGVVVWYQKTDGNWTCLKNKSFDFLKKESKLKDDDNYVDEEDQM